MNVGDQLHKAARLYGSRIAARCDDETLTFAELEERSNRLAHALLARGLKHGERVATWLENSIRCLELDFALAKAAPERARSALHLSGQRCALPGLRRLVRRTDGVRRAGHAADDAAPARA